MRAYLSFCVPICLFLFIQRNSYDARHSSTHRHTQTPVTLSLSLSLSLSHTHTHTHTLKHRYTHKHTHTDSISIESPTPSASSLSSSSPRPTCYCDNLPFIYTVQVSCRTETGHRVKKWVDEELSVSRDDWCEREQKVYDLLAQLREVVD